MKTGIELIEGERTRQIKKEGWDSEHDDYEHNCGELADAAMCYTAHHLSRVSPTCKKAYANISKKWWPWDDDWWKPKDNLRDLVRAGALIAAEIDRIQREEAA